MNPLLTLSTLLALITGVLCTPGLVYAQAAPAKQRPANTRQVASPLSAASSPFLVRASTQLVAWRPWEGAAFREARASGKLVLLWVGASWCHWCHDMGREAFSDPQLAQLINSAFVPIVVDRDLRPDVDRRYQRVVMTLSGRGGWPLIAVLTPDGDAVFGGGYFTADDDAGRPGLLRVLTELNTRWQTERELMTTAAQQTTRRANDTEALISGHPIEPNPAGGQHGPNEPTPVAGLLVSGATDRLVAAIMAMYDPRNGGFGQAPRFPHASTLELLLTYAESTGQEEVLDRALHTLNAMAEGAIRDPLTGLFFRYSADDAWQHPGFEVLLATNVEMLLVYLHAYQLTGRARYQQVANQLVDAMLAELLLPGGGFTASLAGEGAGGEEGGYFTFTQAQLEEVLTPAELRAVQARLGLEGVSVLDDRPDAFIPMTARTLPEVARQVGLPVLETEALLFGAMTKMEDARKKRPLLRDDTVLVAWNTRASSALLEAQRVLGRDDAKAAALRTLEMVLQSVDPEQSAVPHVLPPSSLASMDLSANRISTVTGLLDAFEATGDVAWLSQAQRIMDGTLERFWDVDAGGFYDIPVTQSRNALTSSRWKDVVDGVLPSTNGLAILALQRLSRWTGDPQYQAYARQALMTFEPISDALGLLGATWARAALAESDPAPVVIVAARPGGDPTALVATARRTFRPGTSVVQLAASELDGLSLYELVPPQGKEGVPAPTEFAWVCSADVCSKPITSPERLQEAIKKQGRGRPTAAPPVSQKTPTPARKKAP